MFRIIRKIPVWLVILLIVVLRHDFWFWQDPRIQFGLPVSLLYQLMYCFALSFAMNWIIRRSWPPYLEEETKTQP